MDLQVFLVGNSRERLPCFFEFLQASFLVLMLHCLTSECKYLGMKTLQHHGHFLPARG